MKYQVIFEDEYGYLEVEYFEIENKLPATSCYTLQQQEGRENARRLLLEIADCALQENYKIVSITML